MSHSPDLLQSASEWWNGQSFTGDRWLRHEGYLKLFTKVNNISNQVGESAQGRSILEYTWGKGSRGVIAWSQMHGNEATATYALHDLLLYIQENSGQEWVTELEKRIHFRFIPMVNPDGAEIWSRRTGMNIDPNRDAVALQSVEAKLLMERVKASGAEVAFNLHDQRNIFHLKDTDKSAVISFLAPSADVDRSVSPTRRKAMNWISHLQKVLKQHHPDGAGRYTDEFYPTAFGENVQKLNIPTVLIESGAWPNDPNRLIARKLNFLLLLEALLTLSDPHELEHYAKSDYESIPLNDNKQWDILVKNVRIGSHSGAVVDLGLSFKYTPNSTSGALSHTAVIGDIGDLSHHCGLEVIDGAELLFENGKKLPRLDEVATFELKGKSRSLRFQNGAVLP